MRKERQLQDLKSNKIRPVLQKKRGGAPARDPPPFRREGKTRKGDTSGRVDYYYMVCGEGCKYARRRGEERRSTSGGGNNPANGGKGSDRTSRKKRTIFSSWTAERMDQVMTLPDGRGRGVYSEEKGWLMHPGGRLTRPCKTEEERT